jgi:hypothetical protein
MVHLLSTRKFWSMVLHILQQCIAFRCNNTVFRCYSGANGSANLLIKKPAIVHTSSGFGSPSQMDVTELHEDTWEEDSEGWLMSNT